MYGRSFNSNKTTQETEGLVESYGGGVSRREWLLGLGQENVAKFSGSYVLHFTSLH